VPVTTRANTAGSIASTALMAEVIVAAMPMLPFVGATAAAAEAATAARVGTKAISAAKVPWAAIAANTLVGLGYNQIALNNTDNHATVWDRFNTAVRDICPKGTVC
jgi:hypothetical protein